VTLSRERPAEGCRELSFAAELTVPEAAQPALEDYARAASGAEAAAVVPGEHPGRVRAVHLCGARGGEDESVRRDVEAFARELGARAGEGLGWS
jgi:hypothetical protein